MTHEFSRTEMLIGPEGLQKLKRSHIVVFGAGGVGSHCIDALARSGVGALSIIDHDLVSITNINRQSVAFHSTIGQRKTQENHHTGHQSLLSGLHLGVLSAAGKYQFSYGRDPLHCRPPARLYHRRHRHRGSKAFSGCVCCPSRHPSHRFYGDRQ